MSKVGKNHQDLLENRTMTQSDIGIKRGYTNLEMTAIAQAKGSTKLKKNALSNQPIRGRTLGLQQTVRSYTPRPPATRGCCLGHCETSR